MFTIYQASATQSWEYLPASAITPKIGKTLVLRNGFLEVASGSTNPTYICACEKDSTVNEGEIIPVIRITDDILFETTSSEAMTDVKLGDKVTISADGEQVTASTADGVAEIIHIDNTSTGSKVLVRFA